MIHLHLHTEYSVLDGLPKMAPLMGRVNELGQQAVAITDHGTVSGHLAFWQAARDVGVKPIAGMEGYFSENRRARESEVEGQKPTSKTAYTHITILAKNEQGLKNLWSLSSLAYQEGHYYKPRVDWELLDRFSEGLVVTGGCISGCVSAFFDQSGQRFNQDKGIQRIGRFKEIFDDDFYLEIHTFDSEEVHALNKVLVEVAGDFGIPLIAASDSHYLREEDWLDHEVLMAAQTGHTFDDPSRYQYGPGQLFVMSEEDVRSRLNYLPDDVVDEAVLGTHKIAEQCEEYDIPKKTSMPMYFSDVDADRDALVDAAVEGFKYRIAKLSVPSEMVDEYQSRLMAELRLVIEKGFAGYFLIVSDLAKQSKKRGILVGPSRGSVGGSLLAYVLGITEIDPIRGKLLFERFLDPGRKTIPDIDIDFPPEGREEVRAYLDGKYHTATVGTLSALKPKRLIRDLGKVLKIPRSDIEAIVKVIDKVKDLGVSGFQISWDEIVAQQSGLRSWLQKYPRLFELAGKFHGHIRHMGAHAGGVVVDKEPLLGSLPVRVQREEVRTQFTKDEVEALGFVKMDVLGLRTLDTIKETLEMVWQRHGRDAVAHPYEWQYEWEKYYEDEAVYRSLWEGKNTGVFQLESAGFREQVQRFLPASLEEIGHLVSVFRPGVTRALDRESGKSLLDMFMERRSGEMPVSFRHPKMESILADTYGSMVYQEQVMKTAEVLAGYSFEEQDRIRKILGKMKRDAMREERKEFVRRCVERGVEEEVADVVFDDMETFGIYAFNRSHGYGYGTVTYWTAYLKHYFPAEFITALFMTNEEESLLYAREAKRLGIEVLGPDVHESDEGFTLTPKGRIRYGLHRVKFVSEGANVLQELRPFESLDDLFLRVPKRSVNKRAMLSLIRVGALDSLVSDEDRMRYPKESSDMRVAARRFFDFRGDTPEDFEAWCKENRFDDRAYSELEYLGTTVTVDPMEPYLALIEKEENFIGQEAMFEGERAMLGGMIRDIRRLKTKRGKNPGQAMCQMWVERAFDEGGAAEQIVVFPDEYRRLATKIEVGAPVMVKVERLKDGVMARNIVRLDDVVRGGNGQE